MSQNRFVYTGLEELKAELRALPAELAAEAGGIVIDAAEGAGAAIVAAYPNLTGDLRDHVTVKTQPAGPFGAGAIVKNGSKLAFIFENGTEARHYISVHGVKHLTGKMPPGKVFIPRIIAARRAMYEQLKALLVRHGLEATGDA